MIIPPPGVAQYLKERNPGVQVGRRRFGPVSHQSHAVVPLLPPGVVGQHAQGTGVAGTHS